MDDEDLAELRDSQTLVLQNEEEDIAGKYVGDLASRSLDVDNEHECVQSILVIHHLTSITAQCLWHWKKPSFQHQRTLLQPES